MNKRARNRLIGVSAIILIIAAAAYFTLSTGDNQANKTVTQLVGDQALAGQRVKVAGTVVDDSWDGKSNPMKFAVYDEANPKGPTLTVVYNGVVPSSFGNKTKAILTGELKDGEFVATDMLTQCPTKYKTAKAETVDQLLSGGTKVVGKPMKVIGFLAADPAGGTFTLQNASAGGKTVQVAFAGKTTGELVKGAQVEVSGVMGDDGVVKADQVAVMAGPK